MSGGSNARFRVVRAGHRLVPKDEIWPDWSVSGLPGASQVACRIPLMIYPKSKLQLSSCAPTKYFFGLACCYQAYLVEVCALIMCSNWQLTTQTSSSGWCICLWGCCSWQNKQNPRMKGVWFYKCVLRCLTLVLAGFWDL